MTAQEIKIRIEGLKQQLVAKYHPEKVILFGSAARESEVINDVDIFIVKDDVPFLGAERIRQLYRLIDTDLPVDYLSPVGSCGALGPGRSLCHCGIKGWDSALWLILL